MGWTRIPSCAVQRQGQNQGFRAVAGLCAGGSEVQSTKPNTYSHPNLQSLPTALDADLHAK